MFCYVSTWESLAWIVLMMMFVKKMTIACELLSFRATESFRNAEHWRACPAAYIQPSGIKKFINRFNCNHAFRIRNELHKLKILNEFIFLWIFFANSIHSINHLKPKFGKLRILLNDNAMCFHTENSHFKTRLKVGASWIGWLSLCVNFVHYVNQTGSPNNKKQNKTKRHEMR